eukprot:s775_g12.t1
MAGGDAVLAHNSVRDLVHDLSLKLEASSGRSPSPRAVDDLLMCFCVPLLASQLASPTVLACRAPIGSFESDGTAASCTYGDHKRRPHDTAARSTAAGIRFQPLVLTAQGTIATEGSSVLHGIAEAVAVTEGSCATSVFDDLLERLAVLVARANYRAIARRRCSYNIDASAAGAAIAAAALLHDPGEPQSPVRRSHIAF